MADVTATLDVSHVQTQSAALMADGAQAYNDLASAAKGNIHGLVGAGTLLARGLESVGLSSLSEAVSLVESNLVEITGAAAAGSVIPGIGTVIGAAVGAFLAAIQDFGSLFSPSHDDNRPGYMKAVQEAPVPDAPCAPEPGTSDVDHITHCMLSRSARSPDQALADSATALVHVLWDLESQAISAKTPFGTYYRFLGPQGTTSDPGSIRGRYMLQPPSLTTTSYWRSATDAELAQDAIPVEDYVGVLPGNGGWQRAIARLTRWSPFGFDAIGKPEEPRSTDTKEYRLLHKLAQIALQHEKLSYETPPGISDRESDEIVLQFVLALSAKWVSLGGRTDERDVLGWAYLAWMVGHLKSLIAAESPVSKTGGFRMIGQSTIGKGTKLVIQSSQLSQWVAYYNGKGPAPF